MAEGGAPVPARLGNLPAPILGGPSRRGSSLGDYAQGTENSQGVGVTPPTPAPIAMEGLSHQGAHTGPPNTLHDRVVFLSNVSLPIRASIVSLTGSSCL